MPTSHWLQLNEVLSVIMAARPRSMLDIGIGFGKYGFLAREYLELWDGRNQYIDWKHRIDGIEIFEEYKTPVYDYIYNNVYYGNAVNILPDIKYIYDLIIMIDVIEHFDAVEGRKMLDICNARGRNLLVVTPHNPSAQGAVFDNDHEKHKSRWTAEDISTEGNKIIVPNKKSLICLCGQDAAKIGKNLVNFGISIK